MADIERLDITPRMSGVVIHGDTVYLTGHVAVQAAGQSATHQTRDILTQIDAALARAGSDKTKLLQATIWLADMATFGELNAVWDAWIPPECAPARACVEARLARPKWTVEIAVVAAR